MGGRACGRQELGAGSERPREQGGPGYRRRLRHRPGDGDRPGGGRGGGLIAYDQDPIYAATKHGVVGLTRALAFLKDEANIRVNCVCPSFVDTPLPRRRLESMTGEARARWEGVLARIPMIPPSEVADAVLEIVRDGSLAGEAMALQYGQPRRLIPAAMTLM